MPIIFNGSNIFPKDVFLSPKNTSYLYQKVPISNEISKDEDIVTVNLIEKPNSEPKAILTEQTSNGSIIKQEKVEIIDHNDKERMKEFENYEVVYSDEHGIIEADMSEPIEEIEDSDSIIKTQKEQIQKSKQLKQKQLINNLPESYQKSLKDLRRFANKPLPNKQNSNLSTTDKIKKYGTLALGASLIYYSFSI